MARVDMTERTRQALFQDATGRVLGMKPDAPVSGFLNGATR